MPTAPGLVTVHVWRVRPAGVPAAMLRMGTDRWRLSRTAGVRFARLLGTGTTFALPDADPLRWALLTAWRDPADAAAFEHGPVRTGWRALSVEEWRLDLVPLASRGRWSGREPLGRPVPSRWDGPVAVITRARLRPRRAVRFWRAVRPVARDLRDRTGLLASIGIGEAPVGRQGTLSVWTDTDTDTDAVRAFAFKGAAHGAAIRETEETGWYAEELFARFGVAGTRGTLDGRDPVACLR